MGVAVSLTKSSANFYSWNRKGRQTHPSADWNIPKHLARFEWTDLPTGAVQVKVFPHDTAGDATESQPSRAPFFQTTFKTVPFVPAIPTSTSLYGYLGIDVSLVGPPLPQGPAEELVGTENWAKAVPSMSSRKTHVGWFDMRQADNDGDGDGERTRTGRHENFWPGRGRWVLGVRMDDAEFAMSEAEQWAPPESTL